MEGAAIGLTLAAFCLFVPNPGQAATANLLEEKPLAGITLSLDHYCENVMENAAEEAKQEAEEQESGSSQDTDKEKKDKKSEKDKKEREKKIKLNLKYDKLGIAKVDTYLNVRSKPGESSKIIGKMTRNTGCNILNTKKGWSKIESGNVKGYVKTEYLITGKEAEARALKVATLRAVVNTQTLNVRYLPTTESRIYDQLSEDEEYTVEREHLSKDSIKTYMAKHSSKKDTNGVDLGAMYDCGQ